MHIVPPAYYERHLPHWQPEDRPIFLTWRLHGSLPSGWNRSRLTARPARPGQVFRRMDLLLDRATAGPRWLRTPEIADIVARAFLFGEQELKLYRLLAWVIMPHHVHLLIEALSSLARITKMLKGYTARQTNLFLGRRGLPFWQDESFDHSARNEGEVRRIAAYIEGNPVSAGLAAKPEDWRWSSANRAAVWQPSQDGHSSLS